MASTTSTEQSGLFSHLLPAFKKATGIDVKVVAVGTGQAIDIARRGDADVLFVHDRAAEEKFVAEGGAAKRWPVMYNDFVLVGPKSDPAGVKGKDIVEALRKIAAANAPFISRGDRSGTNAAELRYWKQAGVAAEKWGEVADTTNGVLKDNAQPAVENLQKAIASVQRAADNLDAIVSDARPGVQNFSKSTLPEANQLVRDLRELSQSLKGVSERVEQGGIGGTLGPQKLPDYKPRKQ